MSLDRRSFLVSISAAVYSGSTLADHLQFTPLQSPKPPEKVVSNAKTLYDRSDFRLYMHSASWCGPCQQWKAHQEKQVRCKVVHINGGASRLPTFHLALQYPLGSGRFVPISRGKSRSHGVDSATNIRWTGYTTAGQINAEVDRQIRIRNGVSKSAPKQVITKSQNGRKTTEQLRRWARAHDPTPQNGLSTSDATHQWDIANRNQTDSHMLYHGYTLSQIRGLTLAEKLMIHSGTHRRLITPWA